MVPFIGYPIKYCSVEFIENAQGERTREFRADCDNKPSKDKSYIRLRTGQKEVFSYQDKRDVFSIDYFAGEWFYTSTQINSEATGELASADSRLVKIERASEKLTIIDNSGIDDIGDVQELSKERLGWLPIRSLDFELDKQNEKFSKFGEKLNKDKRDAEKPYIQILFQNMPEVNKLEKVIISPDYFSFVYIEVKEVKDEETGETKKEQARYKVSFLKKSYVQFDQFKAKRFFFDDWSEMINLFPTIPQQKLLTSTEEDENQATDHFRVLKFDTSLYGEEKQSKTKVIKWYFSKNSSKKELYRELAREAIAIYNRAFEIIADGEAPKIQYQLVEGEGQDKDLGDMRYNMINLIDLELVAGANLFGYAPSHHNPETGQTISGILNVNINAINDIFTALVKDYTRYEIFQSSSDKKASDKTAEHPAVSKYIHWKIKKECDKLEDFIAKKKAERMEGKFWDYATDLDDFEILRSCAVKVATPNILDTILHELGHNSSKAHNFECSVDKNNFYKDLNEMKAYFPSADLSDSEELQNHEINNIPQTSCVMDYIPFDVLPLTVLGKNDLRVLRYVYEDELELEGHELSSPKVYPISFNYDNVKDQISLKDRNIPNSKSYRHCNDLSKDQIRGCDVFDSGSSYVKIAQNNLIKFQRALTVRFRYNSLEPTVGLLALETFYPFLRIKDYYEEWIRLRDSLLGNKINDLLDYNLKTADEDVQAYKTAIDPHNSKKLSYHQDYLDYYPSADISIADIFREGFKKLYDQRPLHCLIKDKSGKKHEIALSYLINYYLESKHPRDLYIIDCFSPKVVKFFEEKGLEVAGQEGLQEFTSFSISQNLKSNQTFDVMPFRLLFVGLSIPDASNPLSQEKIINFFATFFSIHVQDLEALVDYDELVKDNILKIDTYGSVENAQKNFNMYLILEEHMRTSNYIHPDSRVLYMRDRDFLSQNILESNPDNTFYNKIEVPLKRDYEKKINDFKFPFLKALYKQYKESSEESSKISFQDYVREQKSVVEIGSKLYIPIEEDSYSFRLALAYNGALNESEILKRKDSLSILEEFRLHKLNVFKVSLRNIFSQF